MKRRGRGKRDQGCPRVGYGVKIASMSWSESFRKWLSEPGNAAVFEAQMKAPLRPRTGTPVTDGFRRWIAEPGNAQAFVDYWNRPLVPRRQP